MAEPLDDDPYAVGSLYDMEYAGHDEDLAWYVLQARRGGGRVLELGCGTGRLTLPIARAGAEVVGIDRAPAMLETLQRKLEQETEEIRARVTLVTGDYADADLGPTFSAVLWPFNALHHASGPEQVVALLTRIRDWLRPGGLLALDCYLPDLELYDRNPDAKFEHRVFADPRTGERLDSWEQGWWDAQTRVHHVLYVYRHADGSEERTRLQLRMYEAQELRDMLARAGWTIEHESADFTGSPVGSDALKWVVVARPTKA